MNVRACCLKVLLAGAAALGAMSAAQAADDTPTTEQVKITDPFIELHTGAGRGYPVFHVAARDELITIEMRHTDWYRVRTESGKVGWVHRKQLETTLTMAGGAKSFRDVLVDDYLNRRVQLGASIGRFKAEPMLKLWTAYRLTDTIGLEGTVGQVQGLFSGTNFWHANLTIEPWSDKRLSPYFAVGFGKFKNYPNISLVGAINTDAKLSNAGIGLRYYLTDRFVLRADYTLYTAFIADTRSGEYKAKTVGLSFFF
jgi:SH3-like domain-containing protein